MPVKLAAFMLTLAVNLVVSLVVLFGMLATLNGFSERQAMNAFVAYGILGVIGMLLVSIGAAALAAVIHKRKVHGILAGLLASIVGTIVGMLVLMICGVIAVGFAEYFRGQL